MCESITAVTVEIKSKSEDLIKNGYYPKTFCKTIHILSFFPTGNLRFTGNKSFHEILIEFFDIQLYPLSKHVGDMFFP